MTHSIRMILLLILANVVVFLWPNKANLAPHVYATQAELNPHFVRLNKEIEDRFYSKVKQDVSIKSVSSELMPEDVDQMIALESAQNMVQSSGDAVCYRLGPFMHQSSYELAQAVLYNANVDFKTSARSSQKSSVFRLLLGPFASKGEVDDARLELKRKRILDHFARKIEDDQYIISLGIYSTKESAELAFRLFADKVNGLKIKNEMVVLPDNFWLHFELQKSSSKFQQLNDIDWGESSAKLGLHSCRS